MVNWWAKSMPITNRNRCFVICLKKSAIKLKVVHKFVNYHQNQEIFRGQHPKKVLRPMWLRIGLPKRVWMESIILKSGQLISPEIELIRPLGHGGMGEIWLSKLRSRGEEIVVKILADCYCSDANLIRRFCNEAGCLKQLNSPHVIQILGQGTLASGRPYLVMEHLQGQDLSFYLSKNQTLSLQELRTLVSQTCDGLEITHRAQIIHRDLKPSNLFLVDKYPGLLVKIIDFGIAKCTDPTRGICTQNGEILGTLRYMSPEQFENPKAVDSRADLWAFAVVVYRALTGHLPYQLSENETLRELIYRGKIRKPSEYLPGLPESVDAWFQKAFAYHIDERFQTAHEVAYTFLRATSLLPKVLPKRIAEGESTTNTPTQGLLRTKSHVPSTRPNDISTVSAAVIPTS
jgi:eukaryotic-like serine/threonine-protein kinase